MIILIKQSLLNILDQVWPTILISSVIVISMRIVYIINNKEEFVFYKEFLSYVFIIYALCLFYVVTFQDIGLSDSNFIPFKEIFRYSFGSNLFIKNVLGNIILFIPYGFFITYFLKLKKPLSAFFLVLLVSVSIEVTQSLIGRVFDIDDIILNVIGGILGFYLCYSLMTVNNHLPPILKNKVIYNIMIVVLIALFAFYVFVYLV